MPSWIVILLSKFGSVSTFYSLHFQYCEISLRVLLMQSFFCCCYFFRSIFILFSQPLFSFMLISLPLLSSSGCISRVPWMAAINIVIICYFFDNFVYVWLEFHFQYYHFLFLWYTFIIVGSFPILLIHFCKMSHTFITRRQGGNSATHLAVCTWTE